VMSVVPLALIAGPYVAALSHKFHRLDFGDSGALNYAWYSANVEKMHLEPWMTDEFGSATVKLQHPEVQLLQKPGVYSYRAVPYGTYPDWFDTAWFNERVVPRTDLKLLVKRDVRNVVLVVRYLFNHPEAWLLLLLLLMMGAKEDGRAWRRTGFWLPMVALGLSMWCIYGLVNIEERYVTLAYLAVVLPVFAMLRAPEGSEFKRGAATAMVALLAFLSLGEMLRVALETRRNHPASSPMWRDPQIFGAAEALVAMGVKPGDEVSCIGTKACLYDIYWARLAGVRITSEIFGPENSHLLEEWEDLSDSERAAALAALRSQGAKVLVAYFAPGDHARVPALADGWQPLGETGYWAMGLADGWKPSETIAPRPWVGHAEGNQ